MVRSLRLGCAALVLALLAGCSAWASGTHEPPKPTTRVTVAGGCPHSLGTAADVRNDSAGLIRQLVPVGVTPDAGLICRYPGSRTQPAGPMALGPDAVGTLARALAQVRIGGPPGETHCPADFGSVAIIVLRYADRDDVDLWYRTSGCQTLDNGHVSAFEGGNPSFYDTFMNTYARLVPG